MKPTSILMPLLLLALLPSPCRAGDPPVFVLKWGALGSGNGQFNSPFGLGLDPSGNVYVADTFNNRVEVFTPIGSVIRTFGSVGSNPGELASPADVAVAPSGDIYVADYGNFRISVFDATGAYLRSFSTSGHPGSIAMDPLGQHLYVLLTTGRMQKFTANGDSLLAWTIFSGVGFQGFAVSADGLIHIGTGGNCTVRTYSPDGAVVAEWGAVQGFDPGECVSFGALALDADGNTFVAGTDGRIQVFTLGGSFITQWGSPGNGDGQFGSTVPDIAIDAGHNIYVLDNGFNRVQKFAEAPTPASRFSWGRLKLLYR